MPIYETHMINESCNVKMLKRYDENLYMKIS